MSDNFQKHKETINSIYRETKESLWTTQFATIILLLFAILFVTFVLNVVFISFGSGFITFFIYLVETLVPLAVLYFHQRKIYEAVREKVSEMEPTHPGIIEAYEEWHSLVAPPNS